MKREIFLPPRIAFSPRRLYNIHRFHAFGGDSLKGFWSVFSTLCLNILNSIRHAVRWREQLSKDEVVWLTKSRTDANNNKLVICGPLLALLALIGFARDVARGPGQYDAVGCTLLLLFVVVCLAMTAGVTRIITKSPRRYTGIEIGRRISVTAWQALACLAALVAERSYAMTGSAALLFATYIGLAALPTWTPAEALAPYLLALLMRVVAWILGTPQGAHGMVELVALSASAFFNQLFFYNFMATQIGRVRLSTIAQTDTLTGLLNRRGLGNWLTGCRRLIDRRKSHVTCGFIDIDKFKAYNDTFGHIQGDECLKSVCGLVKQFFAGETAAVCRFGGEEIVCILVGPSAEEAQARFAQLKDAVEGLHIPSPTGEISQWVTVSIGICTAWLKSHEEVWDLIDQTDEALYLAKDNGRNRVERTAYRAIRPPEQPAVAD